MSSISSKAMADSSILTGPRVIVPPGPTPSTLDKHFDFLEWSPDCDRLLIGTSDLTSRSWGGSIWLFSSEECQNSSSDTDGWKPHADKCVVGAQLDCGVSAGRFIRCSDKFVVGCDSGAIQILSLKTIQSSEKIVQIQGEASLSGHNDMVLDLDDLGGDDLHFVSCGQDKSIKVWDLDNFLPTHTFSPAHTHIVTSVRARPSQPQCFASCSRDGSALLWDTRDELPATSLVNPSAMGLTALSWANETTVVVGGVNGQISAIDVRNTNESKFKLQLDKRPIHSMKSASSLMGLIAACQDNLKVSVVNFGCEIPEVIYTDEIHKDFVRGLAWNEKSHTLWSCGWDSKIFCHQVKRVGNGVA